MLKITLTEEEQRNLLVFMNRVNLTGGEALPFISIYQKVANAENEEVNTDETKL